MNILIINLTRMGDILMSSPMLYGLKKKYPDCKINYMAAKGLSGILKNMPFIDNVIELDVKELIENSALNQNLFLGNYLKTKETVNSLRKVKYDLCINITHTDESKALAYLIGCKNTLGITMTKEGSKIVRHEWANYFYASNLNKDMNRINMVDIYLRTIDYFDTPKKLFFKTETKNKNYIFNNFGIENYFCIQLGASVENKRYEAHNFAKVANELYKKGYIPVFLGTAKELEIFDKAKLYLECKYLNLMGKTNTSELGSILEDAKILISNDTGTMHIASSVHTKILCVALASAYPHETAPYSEGNIILEADLPM